MPRLLLPLCCLALSACFTPPGPSSGGSGGTGASSGSSSSSSSGTTVSTGSSGSSGSSGGQDCSTTRACPVGQSCALQVIPCAGSPSWTETSPGGTCQPYRTCANGSCQGQACLGDTGCGLGESCQGGSCQGLLCPLSAVYCPVGCNLFPRAHACQGDCVCPSCPNDADAGSPDAGVACTLEGGCGPGAWCDAPLVGCRAAPGLFEEQPGSCAAECGGHGCTGACTSDRDCRSGELCQSGSCQAFACPASLPICPAGCAVVSPPHGCSVCACSACPAPDAGATCGSASCAFDCCADRCVYAQSDTQNCGSCGHACGPGQYCASGQCWDSGLDGGSSCFTADGSTGLDCGGAGGACCGASQICCLVNQSVSFFGCYDASAGCPLGCPLCL